MNQLTRQPHRWHCVQLDIKQFMYFSNQSIAFCPKLVCFTGMSGSGKSNLLACLKSLLAPHLNESPCEIQSTLVVAQDLHSEITIHGEKKANRASVGQHICQWHGQMAAKQWWEADAAAIWLDEVAGLMSHRAEMKQHYQEWKKQQKAWRAAAKQQLMSQEQAEIMHRHLALLEELGLAEGEWDLISAEHDRLQSLQQDRLFIQRELEQEQAHGSFGGHLKRLQNWFASAHSLDAEQSGLQKLTTSIAIDIEELQQGLWRWSQRFEEVEQHLCDCSKRMEQIWHVAKQCQCEASKLYHYHKELQKQSEKNNTEQALVNLKKAVEKAEQTMQQTAQTLHELRDQAAQQIPHRLQQPLKDLGLTGAKVQIICESNHTITSTGSDTIVWQWSAGDGLPFLDIPGGLSGGELSRFILALLSISQVSPAPILVIDELDLGLGGQMAAKFGLFIYRLAQTRQILCVTHSPQVAAHADQHIRLEQHQIYHLNEQERVLELARMLSGHQQQEISLEYAKAMLAEAKAKMEN